MTLPGWQSVMADMGRQGHYESIAPAVVRSRVRWVPVNPATSRSGPRWCPDCGAELQEAYAGRGTPILRCPWTREGDRLTARVPVWSCDRPYYRAAGG